MQPVLLGCGWKRPTRHASQTVELVAPTMADSLPAGQLRQVVDSYAAIGFEKVPAAQLMQTFTFSN